MISVEKPQFRLLAGCGERRSPPSRAGKFDEKLDSVAVFRMDGPLHLLLRRSGLLECLTGRALVPAIGGGRRQRQSQPELRWAERDPASCFVSEVRV